MHEFLTAVKPGLTNKIQITVWLVILKQSGKTLMTYVQGIHLCSMDVIHVKHSVTGHY